MNTDHPHRVGGWWRSNRDLRVHAWLLPEPIPSVLEAACGHHAPPSMVVCTDAGQICIGCARATGEAERIPAWARNLPRRPNSGDRRLLHPSGDR
ncbi:hypothetical protein [Amycolatopsis cihanbeyliensis]|uniref:Uncharacterized protein n=1 Tax=Amycolatopsis cihanbeyliensis TaxID=1128664 RepID=A0A542CV17_AMYCI|nr:hypothetical protein [Amycolatopsis cihanbeyliensis]TQI94651.1 hypothetical protein FB471_6823 [Amycolatopsis cihanbeyliensis]